MANKVVIGLVESRSRAESVVNELSNSGFGRNDVSVLFSDAAGTRDFALEKNTKAPEGAITGVGAGGAIGGALGLLAGIGTLAIPGLGPFIAAGPIMAALSGAAAGATVGGIAGALIGMGIPELEAKRYAGKVQSGKALVSVHAESSERVGRAKEVLEAAGAQDVSTSSEARVPAKERGVPSPSTR